MLYTYHSNRLEELATELAAIVASPLPAVFQSEVVVVPHSGMGRWLSLRLADELGLCANVVYKLPAQFVWSAARAVVGEVPLTSPYEPETLTWRLLSALLDPDARALFPELHHFLSDGDELKHYEFARQIAWTFDQYLVYRPDWISAWETGHDAGWQARLWRWLTVNTPGNGILHWVALQQRVFARLREGTLPRLDVNRVCLFAISALSPSYLQFIAALAPVLDLHLFILNPSAGYWADIRSRREIARAARQSEAAVLYLEEGNSLLASFGKQGRDYIDNIVSMTEQVERDCFVTTPDRSLLERVQNDILLLRNRTAAGDCDAGEGLGTIDAQDRSIVVHVCHSALREVEVLHDQLLTLFDGADSFAAEGKITPESVLVMTPDISTYAPFINAVFGAGAGGVRLPYSIADRGIEADVPDMEAFFDLFALVDGRFDTVSIISLLDVPAIRRRLRFADDEVGTVHQFIREAGIRWGTDAQAKVQFGVPATPQHTWRFGLDRLLLGYAMPGHNEVMVEGILPYDPVEGSRALVLGRFYSFVRDLEQWIDDARQRHDHRYWVDRLERLLDNFFAVTTEEESRWELLRRAIRALSDYCQRADFTHAIDHRVVGEFLRAQTQQCRADKGFLGRGVTFCAMVPMRNIPHAVICLIGMNDGVFPRIKRAPSFDLMTAAPRRGDRSMRDDDRYLFLEALLAARQKFYLSYVGQSQRDNSRIPPSVVVSELLDYIEQGYQIDATENSIDNIAGQLVTVHPLQAFGRAYFDPDGRAEHFTYNSSLERASRAVGQTARVEPAFFPVPLTAADEIWRTIDLPGLYAFYRNPARYLLRQRLRLHLPESEAALETHEPFTLDWSGMRQVRTALLEAEDRVALNRAQQRLRAQGALPHGAVGEVLIDEEFYIMTALRERRAALDAGDPLAPPAIDLQIGSFTLRGELDQLYTRGRVVIHPGKAGATHLLQTWLGHVVGQSVNTGVTGWSSYLLAIEGSVMWRPVPVDEARSLLLELLELYWQGMQGPLHFYPKTSYEYALRALSAEPAVARLKALRVWEGGDYAAGESGDEYIALGMRGGEPLDALFEATAMKVYQPMLAAMEKL